MELNEAFWILIKDRIKNRNTENKTLDAWLSPISFVEVSGTKELPRLILGVPTEFAKYFAVENLMEKIYQEIAEVYKLPFEVDIIVNQLLSFQANKLEFAPTKTSLQTENLLDPSKFGLAQSSQPFFQQKPFQDSFNKDSLNTEYIFNTFVVGPNTQFAHAACYNVARNPGADGYNPLFIYGPVGMGKTHLLHAVGNLIKTNLPHLKVQYLGFEKFLNEFISAVRRGETDKIRSKYRDSADILLVDDIQFIGKGESTQTEFFHIINALFERKKQVVLASDRMPKDIINIEDRNRSRLEWGIIADIQMPDVETRMAILRYKAERFNVKINEDVVNYVARISKRSIRELEGNLKKIKMFSELQGLPIDLTLAKRVLSSHETQASISVEDIQKLVADYFKVKILDMKSSTRSKQIVIPRQVSMFLIKKHLDKSLVDIGKAFGGKDHTTVMNALNRIEYLQSTDLDLKNGIDELVTRIHNITGV